MGYARTVTATAAVGGAADDGRYCMARCMCVTSPWMSMLVRVVEGIRGPRPSAMAPLSGLVGGTQSR